MNIFKKRKDFIGTYEGQKSIDDILLEVKEIKKDMGEKAYMFDVYLSLFFTAENLDASFFVATDGNEKAMELRELCQSVIDKTENTKGHKLYSHVCEILEQNSYIANYQEKYTRLNLLIILSYDEFLAYAIEKYMEEKNTQLSEIFDNVRFDHLYRDISHLIGEYRMERFNLMLKQKFLLSSFMAGFVQGITDDVMLCLATMDLETNQYMFAICAENL